MANCYNCKHCYIEDIWNEYDCRKSGHINIDEDGFAEDKEFECPYYEEELKESK